jgi:hypothetical protein
MFIDTRQLRDLAPLGAKRRKVPDQGKHCPPTERVGDPGLLGYKHLALPGRSQVKSVAPPN